MRPLAIFTITQNETVFLQAWVQHYLHHVPAEDLYVINHDSSGDSLDVLSGLCDGHADLQIVEAHHAQSYDSGWLVGVAKAFQQYLLRSYETVIFAATDEFIVCRNGGGLRDYVQQWEYPRIRRPQGYEVVHHRDTESPLDFGSPWLPQRKYWYPCDRYSKPVVCQIPAYWSAGFYSASNTPPAATCLDKELLLLHLHRIDYDECLTRHSERASREWHHFERRQGVYRHNLIEEQEQLWRWIRCHADDPVSYAKLEPIPDSVRELCNVGGV